MRLSKETDMPTSTALLIVQVEIDPVDAEEFNRWYDEEHLPQKLGEPGFISARRFKAHDDENKYLVVYELEGPDAALSPAYMKQQPTEWSKSVMARWKKWDRGVWIDLSA
jgi:hypothetical protein